MPARANRLHVAAALGLYFFSWFIVLAGIAGIIVLNVALLWIGYIAPVLIIVSTIFVVGGIVMLFVIVRFPTADRSLDGLSPVTRAEQPQLLDLVERVATAMGIRPPDRVFIIPEANACASEATKWLGFVSKGRTVGIGLPLVLELSTPQLAAVIAHELAHFAGDTRTAAIANRTRDFVTTFGDMASGPIGLLIDMYAGFYLWATNGLNRQRELEADRWAASIAGSDVAAETLVRVESIGQRWSKMSTKWLSPSWEDGRAPTNVYEIMRSVEVGTDDFEQDDGRGSHPSPQKRIDAMQSTALSAKCTFPATPSLHLLADAPALERSLTALLNQSAAAAREFVPIEANAIAAEVLSKRVHQKVAHMRDVVCEKRRYGDGRDQLLNALLYKREDFARYWNGPTFAYIVSKKGLSFLRPAATAVIADTLVRECEYRWVPDWDRGYALHDRDDRPVDLDAIVDDLLDEPSIACRRLTDLGVAIPDKSVMARV